MYKKENEIMQYALFFQIMNYACLECKFRYLFGTVLLRSLLHFYTLVFMYFQHFSWYTIPLP